MSGGRLENKGQICCRKNKYSATKNDTYDKLLKWEITEGTGCFMGYSHFNSLIELLENSILRNETQKIILNCTNC
jgi:hypothetical protein